MVGVDYNVMLTIFYIFVSHFVMFGRKQILGFCAISDYFNLQFFTFEVPSNLALKHFGSIWLALMITLFGVSTICTAFVQSYGGLIATRVFLGIAEGGTLVRNGVLSMD